MRWASTDCTDRTSNSHRANVYVQMTTSARSSVPVAATYAAASPAATVAASLRLSRLKPWEALTSGRRRLASDSSPAPRLRSPRRSCALRVVIFVPLDYLLPLVEPESPDMVAQYSRGKGVLTVSGYADHGVGDRR